MKKSIIVFITVLLVFYLGGSFTFASFDINEWNSFARGFIAFSSIVFGGFAIGITHDIK